MLITIAVSGRAPITTDETQITLGSHPSCIVAFPDCADVKALHAIIHEVQGRWVVESCRGDLLVVGNADPNPIHDLKPGDVIHLSENCPTITFQPAVDDFLPVVSGDESGPFRLLPIEGGPSPSGTVRTPRPPSSTSIPATDAPASGKSSDRVRSSKSPSSGSIPTAKSRTSGTIRTVNSADAPSSGAESAPKSRQSDASGPPKSNANLPSRKSNADLPARKSDASIPSTAAKRSRSSGQIPVHKPTDDDAIADLPVLQRSSSSWEEELPLAPRRGRSSEQAEMQWIMMVVGRSLAGGAAVLVSWICLSMLWKSLNTPQMDLPSSAAVATVSEVTPTPAPAAHVAPYVPPRSKPTANVEKAPEKSSTTVVATPSLPATTNSETELATTTESAKTNEKTNEDTGSDFLARIDADAEMAVTSINPVEGDDTDDPDEVVLSPLLLASMDSIYAVIIEDPAGKRTRQIGTAWAASERHLVTSATVARMIEEARQQNRIVYALHPTSERKVQISSVRMHNNYRQAARAVEEAIEKRNEKRQATIQKAQVRYDLAVLNVSQSEKLDAFLQFVTVPVKNSKEAIFSMVGLPFEKPDPKTAAPNVLSVLRERHSQKPVSSTPLQSKDQSLTIQFAWHATDPNWSGSPVLNKENEVIGIYAQLSISKMPESRKGRPESAVVWLGHLRDFAADVESRSRGIED